MRCAGWLLTALCAAGDPAFGGTSWTRDAGSIWQDGLLLGDGATAALAYAPMHLDKENDLSQILSVHSEYAVKAEFLKSSLDKSGLCIEQEQRSEYGHDIGSEL